MIGLTRKRHSRQAPGQARRRRPAATRHRHRLSPSSPEGPGTASRPRPVRSGRPIRRPSPASAAQMLGVWRRQQEPSPVLVAARPHSESSPAAASPWCNSCGHYATVVPHWLRNNLGLGTLRASSKRAALGDRGGELFQANHKHAVLCAPTAERAAVGACRGRPIWRLAVGSSTLGCRTLAAIGAAGNAVPTDRTYASR